MDKANRFWGIGAVCLAAVLWGLDGVVLTPTLFNLQVPFVVFMIHAIPFSIMSVLLFKRYKQFANFDRVDIIILLLIATFGGAIGTLAIVKALFLVNFDHLSIVILLQKLQPIFAIVLASIILRERMTKVFITWATIAVVASYFLAFDLQLPNFKTEKNYFYAIIWALLAALSFGSGTVFGKKMLMKYDFVTVTFYRFGFTTFLMLLYVSITGNLLQFSNVTATNWITLLIIAATTGSGAIFVYYFGLNNIKAMTASICELCFPISAVFFDYMLNNHTLSSVQWLAAIVMLFAITKVGLLNESGNKAIDRK